MESNDPTLPLRAAYVNQMKRLHSQKTRGIATPEQRRVWEDEARGMLAAHDAQVRAEEREKVLREAEKHAVARRSVYGYLAVETVTIRELACIARAGGER